MPKTFEAFSSKMKEARDGWPRIELGPQTPYGSEKVYAELNEDGNLYVSVKFLSIDQGRRLAAWILDHSELSVAPAAAESSPAPLG